MASKKISQLTPVTPLLTDLVPLDRPTTGAGAPVTGHATLADIQAAIGGGGGGGFWDERAPDLIYTTGSVEITGSLAQGYDGQSIGDYSHAEGASTIALGDYSHAEGVSSIAIGISSHAEGDNAYAGYRAFNLSTWYQDDNGDFVFALDAGYGDITADVTLEWPGAIIFWTDEEKYNYLGTSFESTYTWITGSGKSPVGPSIVTRLSGVPPTGADVELGPASHAEGANTVSAGVASHSEGRYSFSLGDYSHAEGRGTFANASYSHSEGRDTQADGTHSHAEGRETYTEGNYSHAEGRETYTEGNYSHAEGFGSYTGGAYSHAEGQYTSAQGDYSHAEGDNTSASGAYSHAEGQYTSAQGDYSHAEGGSGYGGALIAQGHYSHAEGYNTQAISDYSHAEGENTRAGYLGYPINSVSQDFINPDIYVYEIQGYGDVTTEFPGQNNEFIVDGTVCTYVGSNYILGSPNNAYITGSGGPGGGSIITRLLLGSLPTGADQKMGEGQSSRGYQTYAIGEFSHAEGVDVRALGSYSHAEGEDTTALGYASHAEGYSTQAISDYSHAEGRETVAYEEGSHAEGIGTIASGSYQHAQGRFNLRNNDFSLLIIGNGDNDITRSDVVRVNRGTPGSGSFEVTGTVYATVGFSGSLTQLTDGRSYLVAGTDISITTASDGQVTIDYIGTGGGGGAQYWDSLQDGAIYTSGSALFRGPAGSNTSPADFGTDVFFYVSGSMGSKDTAVTGTAVFGGDVVISGTLHGGSPLKIGSGLQVTGTLDIKDGLSGSLTRLTDGRSYLVAGTNITITSASNGQVTISSTAGGGGTNYWTERSLFRIYSSGSAEITGSLSVGEAVFGGGTQASGLRSFAQGTVAKSSGNDSHAQGTSTTASGDNSHAEGANTTASGFASHAEGAFTNATGGNSHAEGNSNTAFGDYSHVEGQFNQSIGTGSHSEGRDTSSLGHYSHAEGSGSVSFGTGSHAEGFSTIASGSYQHVQGKFNLRNNNFSLFVIGDGTSNSNRSDIVRVNSGSTGGTGRFEVTGTLAATLGLSGSLTRLVNGSSYLVAGTNITITSESNGQVTIASSGGGGSEFWQSTTAGLIFSTGSVGAFVSGSIRALFLSSSTGAIITGTLSQGSNVRTSGLFSHAQGLLTTGSGSYSHAEGQQTVALDIASHAEGFFAVASGSYSHAEGIATRAIGVFSHAEGNGTRAAGDSSHAEGYATNASGSISHAEGYATNAIGIGSHAEGIETEAGVLGYRSIDHSVPSFGIRIMQINALYGDVSGDFVNSYSNQFLHANPPETIVYRESFAFNYISSSFDGTNTYVTGSAVEADIFSLNSPSIITRLGGAPLPDADVPTLFNQHAEGYRTQAQHDFSHAEGGLTVAAGKYSHAEGDRTLTSGKGSHAEGYLTTGSGAYSHAEGSGSISFGTGSHAEGLSTIASGSYQHVQGKFNLRNNDFSLFVIGDGTSNANRSDIVRVNSGSTPGTGRFEVTGTISATVGLSGSLTRLTNGSSYLVAGTNVTITTASSGQVTISSAIGDQFWQSTTAGSIFATGTIGAAISGSFRSLFLSASTGGEITGSLIVSGTGTSTFTAYTGVRYFPDIVTSLPFTASLTDYIIAVSSSNPTAATNYGIELPSAEFGRTFVVKDISGSAANSNITVTAAGSNDIQRSIDGASNYVLSVNRGSATFVYFGDTRGWGVI